MAGGVRLARTSPELTAPRLTIKLPTNKFIIFGQSNTAFLTIFSWSETQINARAYIVYRHHVNLVGVR